MNEIEKIVLEKFKSLLQIINKIPSKHTGLISLFDTEFVVKGILRDFQG
ncbi:MAG: hypothetical protein HXY52_05785 [Nitrospirae bacterium]|jgi:uncharacterized protein (UPF0332 family)|nr:hypothetical protein [Nitrospirota bacterium]